jgi:photosystem II stability/assembly factor-like uncharacterized protein
VAGTNDGRLFRSRNGGQSWVPLPFPNNLRIALHTVFIDPKHPNLYLAGISSESPEFSGLLRSSNGGESWQPVSAFRNIAVRAISAFRGDRQVLAAGTNTGVFRSDDGGLHWTPVSTAANRGLQPVVSVAFDPNDRNILYAGTPHLAWRTSDGGQTWQSIHVGMLDDSDVFALMVHRNRPQRVFAGACSGIFQSSDGGSAWAKLRDAQVNSHRTYTIVQDPLYENVLFSGASHGLFRSRNGGDTWERVSRYATRSIDFDFHRPGRIYIATDEAGILRSEDAGTSWERVNHGFSNRNLTRITLGENGEIYAGTITGSHDTSLFRLSPDGEDWSEVVIPRLAGEPTTAVTTSMAGGRIYVATPRSILISSDHGETWTRIATPASLPSISGLFSYPWIPGRVLALAQSALWMTRNFASTWTELPGTADLGIESFIPLDPPWVAAAAGSHLLLSSDGETWISSGRMPGGATISGIVQVSSHNLIAATSKGLMYGEKQSASWRPLGGRFEGNTIQAISRHPIHASSLFVAQHGRIYVSSDTGRSWSPLLPDFTSPMAVTQMLVVPGTPDRLLVLTKNHGVLMLPLASTTAW